MIQKASVHYIGDMLLKSLRSYYIILLIILATFIAFGAITYMTATNGGTNPEHFTLMIHTSGVEITTIIYIFVTGLVSFRDTFRMHLQNGMTRKSHFFGMAISALGFAGVAALADTVLGLIVKALLGRIGMPYISVFGMLYENTSASLALPLRALYTIVFLLAIYFMVFMGGYLISTLFFRLNKAGKVGFAISAPILVFWILPMVDVLFLSGQVTMFIIDVIKFALGLFDGERPYFAILFACAASIICGAGSFLLQRRAALKE